MNQTIKAARNQLEQKLKIFLLKVFFYELYISNCALLSTSASAGEISLRE